MTPQIGGPGGGSSAKDDGWGGKGYVRFGLICVLILAGGFGGWAATANLAGAVIASGQLRVETQRQIVQHLDGGVVGQIFVRDGDRVEVYRSLERDPREARRELARAQRFGSSS